MTPTFRGATDLPEAQGGSVHAFVESAREDVFQKERTHPASPANYSIRGAGAVGEIEFLWPDKPAE